MWGRDLKRRTNVFNLPIPMIDRNKAIAVVDEYLSLEYNVDPLYPDLKTSRLDWVEGTHWWQLFPVKAGEEYREKMPGSIGGPHYLVSKLTGELYLISSLELMDWCRDITQFAQGQRAEFSWQPVRQDYLSCELRRRPVYDLHPVYHTISYQNRTEETLELLRNLLPPESSTTIRPRLEYIAVDGIKAQLRTSNFKVPPNEDLENSEPTTTATLAFLGGYEMQHHTLAQLKKWMRINGLRSSGEYWMEILETDRSKAFEEWRLELNTGVRATANSSRTAPRATPISRS